MLRLLGFLFFITHTVSAAPDPQVSTDLSLDKLKYRQALEQPKATQSCQTLKRLSQKSTFPTKDVALLRHAEYCQKKNDWSDIKKQVTAPELQKALVKIQFKDHLKKKQFRTAYRHYLKNTSSIELIKSEFDDLALKALKTNLTKKERSQLRNKLHKKSPRFLPRPKKSDYLKVAKDYRRVRNFEKALYYYRQVINGKGFTYHQRWYAFKGARATYKLERWSRMKKYILSSKQWANFLRDKYKWSPEMTKLHHNANIEYIRTLWTERGQKQAYPELLKIEKEMRGRYSLQMIYWLKGRMAEEKKNFKEAEKWLAKAAKERAITADDQQRVLWSLAWNQRRIGQYSKSQSALDRLLKHKELTFFAKGKYLYWRAENWLSMKKTDRANEAFQALADLDILGYYGSLALRKLEKKFPKPERPAENSKKIFSFFNSQQTQRLSWLIDIGELEVAHNFVRQNLKTKKSWDTEEWVNYFELLQKVGAFKSFFYRYHTLPPKKQVAILKDYTYLLYPRPYRKYVDSAAKDSQVSSSLIYSIMKQESGFDVKARSFADAFGLLQLIPQVAQKAEKRIKSGQYKEPEDLYRPNVIIPLGADTLKHLLTKFKNNFILSVASYNASEKAARGWVKSRFNGDPITFIEDIPYEETKGYVKLVMRNYIAYNRFENQDEEFIFPEVCLEGLQQFK
ncbi:MAG: lytic transglycosylase domain-containing protein [Bdellovibrionales bacterium]|nr:lytic transglycosylase domain-containing protein [Bdellovibrionales bacterium]NQZ18606.1 lytic transglycosylase domain-containing protein [Bdellovibrionales bacterium]